MIELWSELPIWFIFVFFFILFFLIHIIRIDRAYSNIKLFDLEEEKYHKILKKMSDEIKIVQQLNFRIFDTFAMYIPTSRINILFYINEKEDTIFGIYVDDFHFRKQITFFGSYFKEDISITSSQNKLVGNMPAVSDYHLQIFSNISLEKLYQEHRESLKYLERKTNSTANRIKLFNFRENFAKSQHKIYHHMKPFVMFKFWYYQFTEKHTAYANSITDRN